ncbi:hypothetical protein [Kaistia sp. 32K]|uniref:hypothetical protein n=1 Tax=Kaistia sp. 32K TaxID=2795690 RepID=UPI00191501D3|nr:hypothetical protein [Kaistia sp. 32K]
MPVAETGPPTLSFAAGFQACAKENAAPHGLCCSSVWLWKLRKRRYETVKIGEA